MLREIGRSDSAVRRHGRPRPLGGRLRMPTIRFSGAAMAMSTVVGISVATALLLNEQQHVGRQPEVSVGGTPPLPTPDGDADPAPTSAPGRPKVNPGGPTGQTGRAGRPGGSASPRGNAGTPPGARTSTGPTPPPSAGPTSPGSPLPTGSPTTNPPPPGAQDPTTPPPLPPNQPDPPTLSSSGPPKAPVRPPQAPTAPTSPTPSPTAPTPSPTTPPPSPTAPPTTAPAPSPTTPPATPTAPPKAPAAPAPSPTGKHPRDIRPDAALTGSAQGEQLGASGLRHSLRLTVRERLTAAQTELRLHRPDVLPGTAPWTDLPGAVATVALEQDTLVYRFTTPAGVDVPPGDYTFTVTGAEPAGPHPGKLRPAGQESWTASAFALEQPRAVAVRGGFA